MMYLRNHIAEFSQSCYKIGHNDTNLGMFYDGQPYPINSIMNQNYTAWLERSNVIDTHGIRIFYLRKCVK